MLQKFSLFLLSIGFSAISYAENDLLTNDISVVLTPTRLKQRIDDVPSSVTVITSKMLADFGIRSVTEAMRFVPGMLVDNLTGNDYRVNYHGTNILVPRRMNVLVDGVSVYRPAMARVDWDSLPVQISNIDRIEVTRGPNSASYGTNSMLGIVNIITKHPKDTEGVYTKFVEATGNNSLITASYGLVNGNTSMHLIGEQEKNQGFDYSSVSNPNHDASLIKKATLQVLSDLDRSSSLNLQFNYVQALKEVETVDKYQKSFPDINSIDYYLNAIYLNDLTDNHQLKIQGNFAKHTNQQSWVSCPFTAMFLPELYALWGINRGYVSTILSGKKPTPLQNADAPFILAALTAVQNLGRDATKPNCVRTNQNYTEERTHIELQDTYVVSKEFRMVNGFGIRQDSGNSQTYLGGVVKNRSYNIFSNAEYKPLPALTINIGGFLEHDQLTGTVLSPRVAINPSINENNSFRFVISQASRMPGIQEQKAKWSYQATEYSIPIYGSREGLFFQSATAPGNLNSERIISNEIGYVFNAPSLGLLLDAKVFNDRLYSLISEKLQVSDFQPTNNNSVRLSGFELQTSYTAENLQLLLGFSFLRPHGATTVLETTQMADYSGFIGASYKFLGDWLVSGSYQKTKNVGLGQSKLAKQNLLLTKEFKVSNFKLARVSIAYQHLDTPQSSYFRDFGVIPTNYYAQKNSGSLTFELQF